MSNYTKTTDFEAKDSLPTGDSGKIIRGAEFETEFDAIATAIATKADTAGPTFTGTLTFDTISDGTISIAAFVDEDDMSSNSAVLVPTQQSVKAYVDAVTTELNAQDLDFQADSGGALSIDLDTETMTFTGGTGIDTSGLGNAVTFAIDSTVATLTGTQTLTNKTLTSPDVNTPDIDGGTIDGATIATSDITVGTGKTLDVSGGTLTLADNQISGDKVEGGTIASTTITSLASTTVDTTNVEVTNIKAKDGTSAGSIADTTGVVTLASSVLTTTDINGGTIDGATIGATTPAAVSATTVSATGNITVGGTVDGRDIATDGTKLDTVETNADVTDTTNVTAAGALMDSELTDITAVKSLDQGVATTDSPTFAGLTTTADVSFGDNDKAVFGAGSDLQIYHDGSNSYIEDAGTGVLFIKGTGGVYLRGKTTDEDLGRFLENGAVDLYYDGSSKLSTTSTGIDVTGTVTADGLTVDGNATITGNAGAGNFGVTLRNDDGAGHGVKVRGGNNTSSVDSLVVTKESDDSYVLKANSTGDISFYEDTGTTAKLFWDASAESLSIGAPSADNVTIYSTDDVPRLEFEQGGTVYADIGHRGASAGARQNIFEIATKQSEPMAFRTNNTERMRIDSSGNFGLGVVPKSSSSPTWQHIQFGGTGNLISRKADATVDAVFASNYYVNASEQDAYITTGAAARMFFNDNVISFDQAASGTGGSVISWSEAMRIDSSGNLLVGKSSSDVGATAGFEWYDTANVLTLTRSGGHGLSVNRLSSDGDVVTFRKDGTTVGSIQSRSGAVTTMVFDPRSNGSGITGTTNGLLPTNQAGTPTNDHVDLGSDSNKFRDLYLSGGAYLGGTASGNLLDDYEEGSWEPRVYYQNATDQANATDTVQSGKYVKIGNIVILSFRLDFTAPSSPANDNIGVKNFPFAGTNNHYNASGTVITSTAVTGLIIGPVLSGSTQAVIQRSDNTGNYGDEFGTGTGKYIRGTITYLTN